MSKSPDHLTLEQQIFLLNAASNLVAWKEGTPEKTIEELANEARKRIGDGIQEYLEPWKLVWGPAVYMHENSGIADHVMFAAAREAEGDSPARIVISIAGSNGPRTSYNWQVNNLRVREQKEWARGKAPQEAKISEGTWIGLENLQKLRPLHGFEGSGQTIDGFLSVAMEHVGTEVTVTGFSLGGALSPALALWLEDTHPAWDPQGKATIYCRPVAGPTLGNKKFAEYFDSELGDRTVRLENRLDIVPHAWRSSDLKKVPDLYRGYVYSPLVYALSLTAQAWVFLKAYTHVEVERTFDRGILESENTLELPEIEDLIASFDSEISDLLRSPTPGDQLSELEEQRSRMTKFLRQAALQHTKAYALEMEVYSILEEWASDLLEAASGTTDAHLAEIGGVLLGHFIELQAREQAYLQAAELAVTS